MNIIQIICLSAVLISLILWVITLLIALKLYSNIKAENQKTNLNNKEFLKDQIKHNKYIQEKLYAISERYNKNRR